MAGLPRIHGFLETAKTCIGGLGGHDALLPYEG
jgi:hypothetical protein